MRRDPRAYLWDALTAAQAIQRFVAGHDAARYIADELLHSVVERKFDLDPRIRCGESRDGVERH